MDLRGGGYIYSNGVTQSLGFGQTRVCINNSGQILYNDPPSGASIYANGVTTNLGTLGLGGESIGIAINDAGQVTGASFLATSGDSGHAFLYSNGVMIRLGELAGDDASDGASINDLGQVVGTSFNSQIGIQHPFVYSNGVMTDLNSLVAGTGWVLESANGINDQGQIVGTGIDPNGDYHAYVLFAGETISVPEPNSFVQIAVAMAVFFSVHLRMRYALTPAFAAKKSVETALPCLFT